MPLKAMKIMGRWGTVRLSYATFANMHKVLTPYIQASPEVHEAFRTLHLAITASNFRVDASLNLSHFLSKLTSSLSPFFFWVTYSFAASLELLFFSGYRTSSSPSFILPFCPFLVRTASRVRKRFHPPCSLLKHHG